LTQVVQAQDRGIIVRTPQRPQGIVAFIIVGNICKMAVALQSDSALLATRANAWGQGVRAARARASDQCIRARRGTQMPSLVSRSVPQGATPNHDAFFEALLDFVQSAETTNMVELTLVLQKVRGHVWSMAQDERGCRLLQWLLGVTSTVQGANLVAELAGHVRDAVHSPHANHVLQRSIELLPPASVDFVLYELQETHVLAQFARHRFGCRVLERLIEHFPAQKLVPLVNGVTGDANVLASLCRHPFGNFVVQHFLEHGDHRVRSNIVDVLLSDIASFACDRHAHAVVEKALNYSATQDQHTLAAAIKDTRGLLQKLACCRFFGGIAGRVDWLQPSSSERPRVTRLSPFM